MATPTSASAVKQYSKFYEQLYDQAKARYREKLRILGDIEDPYVIGGRSISLTRSIKWQEWPDVEYPDIYNYLIATPSPYTKEQLRAYKSLDAYNFINNGWIDKIHVMPILSRTDSFLVRARVRHSQRLSATPLQPWVGVEKVGVVICGHCDCMAGLGEACSHLAAILFALEANTRIKKSMSCTSLPCAWVPPTFQSVPYSTIAEIDFKQKRTPEEDSHDSKQSLSSQTMEPTETELQALYSSLSSAGKPAVLSITRGFASAYIPLYEKGVLPVPLSELYKEEYMGLTYTDLLEKCEEAFETVTVTNAQAKNVEENTRKQYLSKKWFQQRAGRVTASKLKQAVRTSLDRPSHSLIKAICYPESSQFHSKATSWGCEHEKDAREKYITLMGKRHNDFSVQANGMFIDPAYPFMGASPDGIIECG